MKKALVLFGMLALAAPAHADMTHRISSSVQLNVQSAATQATRLGNSFSTSGSGVNTDIGGGSSADGKLGGFGTKQKNFEELREIRRAKGTLI